jgi:hypothetical protein
MISRSAKAILVLSLLATVPPADGDGASRTHSPADSLGQSTAVESETPAAAEPSPDSVAVDTSAAPPVRSYLFLPDRFYNTGTTLTFSARPRGIIDGMLGFETYRATRRECALQGAGMGMRLGMAAGAFGMMAGAWDEKETWYIAGAMTALGALYGGLFKADDPKFNLRVRVKTER